jgi:hypothetical protein
MPFNWAKKKARHPISKLRSIEGLEGLRPSDIETNDVSDIQHILDRFGKTVVAVHGRGDNWVEVDRNYSPYKSSPLVTPAPNFGGNHRQNMPGAGDMHINDDSDKEKSTKGQATNDDFDPSAKRQRINDALEFTDQDYIVRLFRGKDTSQEMAKKLFGEEGKADGTSVYIIVNDYEQARRLQMKVPGAVIETGG